MTEPFKVGVDLVRARGYAKSLCERKARSEGEDMANRTYAGHLVAMADEIDRLRRIVECVVRSAGSIDTGLFGGPLWVRVADLCGLGSTSATALCREFGVDPDEKIPTRIVQVPCESCYSIIDDDLVTICTCPKCGQEGCSVCIYGNEVPNLCEECQAADEEAADAASQG